MGTLYDAWELLPGKEVTIARQSCRPGYFHFCLAVRRTEQLLRRLWKRMLAIPAPGGLRGKYA